MFEVRIMNNNESVYFNKYGEIIGRGYDGHNHYEQVIFDSQQIEAIKLIIQECNKK